MQESEAEEDSDDDELLEFLRIANEEQQVQHQQGEDPNEQALGDPVPMEPGRLQLSGSDHGEAASMLVLPEQVYLELFRRLPEASQDAHFLAWFIRNHAEWMERANSELRRIVNRHVNATSDLLPLPSDFFIAMFMREHGIDLNQFVKAIKKRQRESLMEKSKKQSVTAADGRPAKRPKRYKCGVCREHKIDKYGRPHLCRPTMKQVVAEVKRQMSKISTGKRPRRATLPLSSDRGEYLCNKCGCTKVGCDCRSGPEYKRIAVQVQNEMKGHGNDDGQNLDACIRKTVEDSMDFYFDREDGRRVPQSQVQESVSEMEEQFRADGASASVGLDQVAADRNSVETDVDIQLEARREVYREVRNWPQMEENIELLRQRIERDSS